MKTARVCHKPSRYWRTASQYSCLLAAMLMLCPPVFGMDKDELRVLLEDARVEMKMPGLRAAVRYSDGRIVRAATGLADKKAELPLDSDIGMPGGSTGKTFVAAVTLLLVEDGVLSLDDPVSKWLGDEPWYGRLPNGGTMQVRHLLSHSSGLNDYIASAKFHFKMIGRVVRHGSAYFEPGELIELVLDKKPLFPAGEGYQYTDAGYIVLGLLIEAASGQTYFDLLRERILAPHGLDGIRPADTSFLPGITPGYQGGGSSLKKDGRMKLDPRTEWTGGGLVTNPTMLVRFFGALAEGRVVKPASLDLMVNSGWHSPEPQGWHYGFGLFVGEGGRSYGHGGLWPGYRTRVWHYAASGMTVAVQTNRDGRLDLEGLVTRIATAAKEQQPGYSPWVFR